FAVGDHVVHPLDQGGAPVGQAGDHEELPRRMGRVERAGDHASCTVEDLVLLGRGGAADVDPVQVVVDVEVGILLPGRGQAEHGGRHDALAQTGDVGCGAAQA